MGFERESSRHRKPSILPSFNLDKYYEKLQGPTQLPVIMRGRVRRIVGNVIMASLPNARIGEICSIEPAGRPPVKAQVVGFDDEDVFLTPFDPLDEVGPQTRIVNRSETLRIAVGEQLLGRVIDSLGNPIDGKGVIPVSAQYPVRRRPPQAMQRRRIDTIMPVGVRAVDMLLSVGEGQRMGIFSSAGVGKSSLVGMLARNSQADIIVVGLVGERGREVQDFLEDSLGEQGLKRSIVVVSTSDEPPLRRIMAAYTATAVAEYFRDQGLKVLLLMDSVTRFARSLREIALSIGEPPARQGFPPSVFTTLPELFERAGKVKKGSITAFYTVLLSSEQLEDPLGEEIRALLDGHLYLSSRLSKLQHYPAIDILASNSRVMDAITTPEHKELSEKILRLWAIYEENRDLISIGAYKRGSDPDIDLSIEKRTEVIDFLTQRKNERVDLTNALADARRLMSSLSAS